MKEAIKKFIIVEIEKLAEKFPEISFKYGFDRVATQHLIEIEPDTEFKNELYMNAEFDLIDAFICKFPEEDILFISNDKHIRIENVVYKKEGTIKVADKLITATNIYSNKSIIEAPFSFFDYYVNASLSNIMVCEPIPVNDNNIVKSSDSFQALGLENDYAMAA